VSVHPVVYASDTWGVHDQRWVAALESCGFAVEVFTVGVADRDAILTALPSTAPVLAGPLTTVTRALVDLPRRVVGLSWGFDIQPGHAQAAEPGSLDWLPSLDALIVDSPSSSQIAQSLGMDPARIHLLPWGIDLEAFPAEGPAADLGLPHGTRVVLSLRRHDDLHRTADIVEAFGRAAALDPHLVLVMGGSGPLTDQHRLRVTELGLADRVRFTGHVDETDIAPLLRAADLYVTATETDGTSVTLLQAMACGVPVLASAIPGNEWWIEDGVTGRTFAVGDIDALAELMVGERRSQAVLDAARAAVLERADWQANRRALATIMRP
jgi:glycosyltransferase involved in cell wall biosynthesis